MQPHGTVAFADLPALADVSTGWMFNISDEFTTTDDFKEGAGNVIPAGANIYKTSDDKWDVLAGTPVTGIKGVNEDSFRRGNVELTAENVGAVATGGDTAENTATFTSSDVADGSASAWTTVSKLSSGEKHSSIFAKVSQMFKNVRYLYEMLGTTDISKIGNGTCTGAISSLNSSLGNSFKGKYDVLVSSLSNNATWTQYQIADVTKYKFIQLQVRDENYSEIASNIIAYDFFKDCNTVQRTFGVWANAWKNFEYCVLCCYVDNTHVALYVGTGLRQVVLSGLY